ncbi:MAG: phosphate regulon sensor histidine kinase PhoR [Gammaproteobacteria bacterium]|nr:phosphate regulon sensor histidine kinase PhoR [Gammaproteobacteria bacterium]
MSIGEKFELKLLAGILMYLLVAGLLTENLLLISLLGLLVYLAWHLYHLLRLTRLIRQRRYIRPPYPPGLWGEIHQVLEQAQTSGRKRKRGLVRFVSRFRKAAAAMPDGLVLLDQNQRIEWANPAANTLLNIRFSTDEGRRILDLLRYPFLEEYLLTADFNRPLEFSSPGDSGQVISLQVIPFGENKGRWLLVAQDITKVFNLNQTRKDFVANVSHELRTPLTVIAGFIENLLDAEKLSVQERPLLLMQQQSSRMESTINDLLSLSRLEMEQEDRIQKLVQVPSLLAELIEEARILSGKHTHRFLSEIDPNLGLLGNESELRSALSNLIFNAVKHTPSRAEIRVFWKFEDQKACFTVRDSGEGIVARHIPRLAERFYRVDTGRSHQSGGSGLGLAIVKHVVSRHGGKLDIQSKVGMGSTFRCDFPEGIFCFLRAPAPDDSIR